MTKTGKSFGASDFFARFRREYERQGWTQERFAVAVSATGYPMKQPRVSELLKGAVTRLQLEEVEALAKALHMTGGALAFGEGEESENHTPVIKRPAREVTAEDFKKKDVTKRRHA